MEDFVSKIPENIFEILLDLGIDPVSTPETEDYFYHLVTDYTGAPDAFETYLKESVERDFKSMSPPQNGCRAVNGSSTTENPKTITQSD